MKKLQRQILCFLLNEDGPTAVEYAVMLALIILVCIASIGQMGQVTNGVFGQTGNALAVANGS